MTTKELESGGYRSLRESLGQAHEAASELKAALRPKVLLIDDDYSIRKTALRVLHDVADITTAATKEAAKELLKTHKYDLIVSDGEGFPLMPEVHEKWPNLPITVFSASSKPEELPEWAKDWLEKPGGQQELTELILANAKGLLE